jgi:hypothetical protein
VLGLYGSYDGFGIVASYSIDILDGIIDFSEDPIYSLDLSGLTEGLRPGLESIDIGIKGVKRGLPLNSYLNGGGSLIGLLARLTFIKP